MIAKEKPTAVFLSEDRKRFLFVEEATVWVCTTIFLWQWEKTPIGQHMHGLNKIDDVQLKDGEVLLYEKKSRLLVSFVRSASAKIGWVLKSVVKLTEGDSVVHRMRVGTAPVATASTVYGNGGLFCVRTSQEICSPSLRYPQNFVALANEHLILTRY